jgi:hypothetical protein
MKELVGKAAALHKATGQNPCADVDARARRNNCPSQYEVAKKAAVAARPDLIPRFSLENRWQWHSVAVSVEEMVVMVC